MKPVNRLVQNLKYDFVVKVLLLISAIGAAIVYSYHNFVLIILFVASVLLATSLFALQKLVNKLLIAEDLKNTQEFHYQIKRYYTHAIYLTAGSNPMLLLVYYLLYFYFHNENLPLLAVDEYFTYAAFGFFTYALSFYIGRSQLQSVLIELRIESGEINPQEVEKYKQRTRKQQFWRILPMLILVVVLGILFFSRYYHG